MSKACRECGEVKSLSAFHRNGTRNGQTRYRPVCKVCIAESERVRQRERYSSEARSAYWHAVEKPKRQRIARVRASQRRYNARNADQRRAAYRAWRDANREHLAAYYAADAQNRKVYQREWRRANPERIRAYRQAQPARPRNDFLAEWRRRND